MSETAIAFARLCLCGVETTIAFARAGRAPIETAVAFAVEKWVFLAWFSVAEVMVVSMVAVLGRAVVMAVSMVAVLGRAVVMVVSCWPVSAVAVVSVVSMSPCCRALCTKKFAMHAKNAPNWAIWSEQGEFYTAVARRGSCWASLVSSRHRPCHQLPAFRRPLHRGAARPGNLRRSRRPHSTFHTGGDGGFAALGGGWRRVVPLMTPFPPFGVGQAPTGGGVAAKLQTTSAKNADNGLPWARWSAFWAQQCRTWCVVRM